MAGAAPAPLHSTTIAAGLHRWLIRLQVLEGARNGIHEEEEIEPVPTLIRKRHRLESEDPARRVISTGPELRSTITFRQVNLMEPFRVAAPPDLIWCRTVLICSDQASQEKPVGRFHDALAPGDYLFVGHSETLSGLRVTFGYEVAATYQRPRRSDEQVHQCPRSG